MLQPGAMRAQYAAGMMTQPNGMAMSSEMAKRGIPANRNAYVERLLYAQYHGTGHCHGRKTEI